jgi:hypothetical protein
MSEDFNMSMRKFLKQVGVTSQQAIEETLRDANAGDYEIEAEIKIPQTGMTHTVKGVIKVGE